MQDYHVSFIASPSGQILFDVHKCEGRSQFITFAAVPEVRAFFSSLGLNEEKVAEIEAICEQLEPGGSYHQKMFLPDDVIDVIAGRTGERNRIDMAGALREDSNRLKREQTG
jgi:hypothetical protein